MSLVKDVLPSEELKALVNEFMADAGINMGSEFTKKALDRVIEIITYEYKFLPIYVIASGFKKGSLGYYEAGRLVPRTINGWMSRAAMEYNRDMAHKAIAIDDYSDAANLNKYPIGSAIIKKMEWVTNGIMSINDWGKIPLKELARRIAAKEPHRYQDFNIMN